MIYLEHLIAAAQGTLAYADNHTHFDAFSYDTRQLIPGEMFVRPERLTWLEIDLSAIANNTRRLKELVEPCVRVMVSVKADGYGHGR